MKYDYTCAHGHTFEGQCTIAERLTPKVCPYWAAPRTAEGGVDLTHPIPGTREEALAAGWTPCDSPGEYDAASTIAGNRIIIDPMMNDLKGYMDRKYGGGKDANGYQGGQRNLKGGGGSYFAGDTRYEKNWHSGADS